MAWNSEPVVGNRWLIRMVLTLLILGSGVALDMWTSEISLLQKAEQRIFETLLSRVKRVDWSRTVVEAREQNGGWDLWFLEEEEASEPNFSVVEMRPESEVFDGSEPQPLEIAYLFSKLHEAGVKQLGLGQNLFWQQAEELDLMTLSRAARPFESVVLPFRFGEAPRSDVAPDWLFGSFIPSRCLRGDASKLPLLNVLSENIQLEGVSNFQLGFGDFGARDGQFREEGKIPVLARWGEDFVPSWALRWAMEVLGVASEELEVIPGRYLRLGPQGPVLPLDLYGRVLMDAGGASVARLPASELISLEEGELPELESACLLIEKFGTRGRNRGELLLQECVALLSGPRPSTSEQFVRLHRGWEWLILLEIIVVSIFAMSLKPKWQAFALGIAALALSVILLGLLGLHSIWTPVLPLLLATVVAWCLVGYLVQVSKRSHEAKIAKVD